MASQARHEMDAPNEKCASRTVVPGRSGEGGTSRCNRKESERFKSFTYDEPTQRDKVSLDFFWLEDDALEASANLPAPKSSPLTSPPTSNRRWHNSPPSGRI